jgi:general secretion pathway protein G
MEVLLVLVILVILGSMAGIFIRGAQRKALVNAARAEIGVFEQALELYQLDMRRYPADNEGLEVLVTSPSGGSGDTDWQGPYLKSQTVPVDPWKNPYQYSLQQGGDQFEIRSWGPDGQDGTDDDISSLRQNQQQQR